jgi:hypothetical protein
MAAPPEERLAPRVLPAPEGRLAQRVVAVQRVARPTAVERAVRQERAAALLTEAVPTAAVSSWSLPAIRSSFRT